MKKVLIVLALVTAFAFAADSYLVDDPGQGGSGTDDMLQYDSGTAAYYWHDASYWGTWFDVTDFVSVASDFECNYTEWWFYEHPDGPYWDTDQAVLELWVGDVAGPVTKLTSDQITATSYTALQVDYATPVLVGGTDFWMISDASVYSSDGSPYVLTDGTDNFTGIAHSFASGDFFLWDPLESGGINTNMFFRAEGTIIVSLDSESWGAIKGLYR